MGLPGWAWAFVSIPQLWILVDIECTYLANGISLTINSLPSPFQSVCKKTRGNAFTRSAKTYQQSIG